MFFSVVKTFSRGGSEKLKRKRIQKKQFLDLIFKIKTPHPNPLPASGKRG